jgi:transposase
MCFKYTIYQKVIGHPCKPRHLRSCAPSRPLPINSVRDRTAASVASKMPRSTELSEFEKGVIVGYHRNGRSIRDISSELKYPKSTVGYVIRKWKVSGDCRNVPRPGRPTKLGVRDRRVLSREIRKNRTQPLSHNREEIQHASVTDASMNTILKEAHLLGYH